MEFIDSLNDKTIIITNYSYKLDLLKKIDSSGKLLNVKFMTMEEVINKFYFTHYCYGRYLFIWHVIKLKYVA